MLSETTNWHVKALCTVGLLFAAGATAVSGCSRTDDATVRWRSLDTGLDYAVVHTRGTQSKALVTVHVLKFAAAKWQTKIVDASHSGTTLSDAAGFRAAAGAVAAINGGYFDPEERPLGLLVSEGKERSRLRKVDHGVLTISTHGAVALHHARSFSPPADMDFAIECGPRLVVPGKTLTFKPGIARRTAIGVDKAGFAYWIVTSGVISLTDFATFLGKPTGRGGLGLRSVLNLDGGSSSMFDLAVGEIKASVRSSVQIPIGLALVRRR